MFILAGVVLAVTFFYSNEDFVGEIVSERFFVLRHKFFFSKEIMEREASC